jgi:putative endonuclease
MQGGIVYILSNIHRTVFYVGFTTHLKRRIREHKMKQFKGFTAKYNCTELLYYVSYFDADEAMAMEKRIKRWKREWKLNLIRSMNPHMIDQAKDWYDKDGNTIE